MVPTTAWTPGLEAGADVAEGGVGDGEVDDDVGVAEHLGQLDPERRDRPCRPAPVSSASSTASQTACAHAPGGAGDRDPRSCRYQGSR